MEDFARLATAFQYPTPDRLAELERTADEMENGAAKRQFRAFVNELQGLSLPEWEELPRPQPAVRSLCRVGHVG